MGTFKLPDLGEGLAEAEILEWHVKPGDHVVADQPMVSVETAKAVVEVPAPFSGTVTALHGAVGDVLATGSPLVDFDSGTVVGRMPSTREEEFVDLGLAAAPAARDVSRLRAVPVARALAKRLDLDLRDIEGSGSDGLIRLDDVLERAGIASRKPARVEAAPGSTAEPLRGARRAMAHSMSASRDQVAGSTVCDDADLHGWTHRGDYMVRIVRAMIAACAAEPALNAWYDSARNSRILLDHIDLAIAVDTDGGLIVPVLRDIRDKTAVELRTAIAAQKEAARRRSVQPADLRDFTLMLSNFGTLAGRYAIPLVVPPAVAILGTGLVREDAVVAAGAVAAHRRMPLSLTFDHRCVTGGEACRFLAAIIADLEKPD
ncbi:MAG TPA: dihydrolipoamide acetyltransferase family protein [Steroidobacteraceae bacterium]|nr:dihydrolipoamide acetyltransferase family protein [Steroidobacteraceae bacterium]